MHVSHLSTEGCRIQNNFTPEHTETHSCLVLTLTRLLQSTPPPPPLPPRSTPHFCSHPAACLHSPASASALPARRRHKPSAHWPLRPHPRTHIHKHICRGLLPHLHAVFSLGFSVSGCKSPLPLSPRAQPLGLAGRGWLTPHVRKGSPRARAACPPAPPARPDLPREANGWLRL